MPTCSPETKTETASVPTSTKFAFTLDCDRFAYVMLPIDGLQYFAVQLVSASGATITIHPYTTDRKLASDTVSRLNHALAQYMKQVNS